MKTTPKKIPKTAITERQLRQMLIESIGAEGTATSWAKEHNITPQAVSAFERQVQGAGRQIPGILGYKPTVIYIPVDEDDLHITPPSRLKATPKTKDQILKEKAEARKVNKKMTEKEKKPKKDKKKKKGKKGD